MKQDKFTYNKTVTRPYYLIQNILNLALILYNTDSKCTTLYGDKTQSYYSLAQCSQKGTVVISRLLIYQDSYVSEPPAQDRIGDCSKLLHTLMQPIFKSQYLYGITVSVYWF